MLSASIAGLMSLFDPTTLLFMAIGVFFGLIIGILPGLGGIAAMALILPFSLSLGPVAALAMLLGAHVATILGSSITSILFNIPGASKSIALCFDGYPMTQKGEGARALGAAAMSSLIGGLIGAIFLTMTLPIMKAIMMALGPPEYFVMALWGLSVIALFSSGSLIKGLIAAGFGLLLSFVGMDPVSGTSRYTFGSLFLMDGLDFAVVVIGLFAISEIMKLYITGGSIVKERKTGEMGSVMEGVRDVFRHWKLVIRSSLLGLFIGALPGVGASIGGIAAYGMAAQTSKNKETFGTGNVEGVIAPEATNAANEGGGLVPTLGFGVPGGESMAILLSAFIVMGIAPGRDMLENHMDLVFSIVWVIVIANVMCTLFGLFTAKHLAKVTMLPSSILIPVLLPICLVGAYAIKGRIGDVIVAVVFGFVGYFMNKYNYSRADMAIGMVLGLMLERYMHISISLYGGLFFITRPVTFGLLLVVLSTIVYPFVRSYLSKKRMESGVGS
ncbi:MAG: tripartite tricarboxylate transporter permease [Clostridia bacterium]|nr:tripartite tricarboxylate transporter permease [Clostridia bacterium]